VAHASEALLCLGQILFLAVTRLTQTRAIIDDAHIHFRIAENFASGHGLLYNVGERALATTSPVYAALLGALGFLTPFAMPTLAIAVNFAFDVGSALLALLLLARVGVPLLFRHAVVLVISSEPTTMLHSAAGMEMSLFVFASLLTLELLHRNRWLAGGLLLGTLGWIRPEAAVFAVGVVAGLWFTGRRVLLARAVGVACASALMLSLVLWLQCGDVIPLSIRIKFAAPWFTEHNGSCATLFARTLGELTPIYPFASRYRVWNPGADWIHMGFLCALQIGLMLLGARHLWREGMGLQAIALPLWALGQWAFYAVTNPFLFGWYLVPFLWVSLLLSGVGLWEAALLAKAPRGMFAGTERRLSAMSAATLAVCCAGFGLVVSAHRSIETTSVARGSAFRGEGLVEALAFRFAPIGPGRPEPDYIAGANLLNQWIGNWTEMRVGLWEIGVFGSTFRGKVLDSCGLVSPEILTYLQENQGTGAASRQNVPSPELFLALRPELLALPPFYATLLPDEFGETYRAVPAPDLNLLLFVREDVRGIGVTSTSSESLTGG
jgi:hypothetical protein